MLLVSDGVNMINLETDLNCLIQHVIGIGHNTMHALLLLEIIETYHSVKGKTNIYWKSPCYCSATINNKWRLAEALKKANETENSLMLPAVLAKNRSDIGFFPVILKPPDGGCGKGISVHYSRDTLPEMFSTRVVTRLIHDPFLYWGTYKADLRMFAIFHPHSRRVLLYEDALVRCAQVPINSNTISALITNYTIQKDILNGSAPPVLSCFEEYVADEKIRQSIYAYLLDGLVAVGRTIFKHRYKAADFLMVGFDVLLRSNLNEKPVILEFNVEWDRTESSGACVRVQRGAVKYLALSLVGEKNVPRVRCATW